MIDLPFSIDFRGPGFIPTRYDNHIQRYLSAMQGQFLNTDAYTGLLATADNLIYEVYEIRRPEMAGELLTGISIVYPGRVGDEFYMTKGHFHKVLETAEVYYCLNGRGCMVMENPEGEWAVEELSPGRVLFVPPRWAHRSVNTALKDDLITFFVYPGNAGHNYGTIEQQGFRKVVLATSTGPQVVDNPRWMNPSLDNLK